MVAYSVAQMAVKKAEMTECLVEKTVVCSVGCLEEMSVVDWAAMRVRSSVGWLDMSSAALLAHPMVVMSVQMLAVQSVVL